MALDFKLRSLLKLNFKLFLDMHMLREGAFINVSSGQQFYDGNDMSLFLPDTTADDTLFGISNGQVWQSPFRQFVYESGVPLDGAGTNTPPVVASGLFIEGSFRPTDDDEFGHVIDYVNGRVIFNEPQSLDLTVQGEFAAREVRIGFEHDFNQQFTDGVLGTQYFTNPLTSNQIVYPSGNIQLFPAVFISVDNRSFSAYELGNRSAIIEDTIRMYVWAQDDVQRDNIVDILTQQWRKALPMIDFNIAPLPLSGIYNTISSEYIPYQKLLRNNKIVTTVGSGVPVRYITYIDDVQAINMMAEEEYERAQVIFKVKTYLNAPITPLGHVFGPISTLPTINDVGNINQ